MNSRKTRLRSLFSALLLTTTVGMSISSTSALAREGGFNGGDGGDLLGQVGPRLNRKELIRITKEYTRPRVVALLNGISSLYDSTLENEEIKAVIKGIEARKAGAKPSRRQEEGWIDELPRLVSFAKKISETDDFVAATEPLTIRILPNGCRDKKGVVKHGVFYTKDNKPYVCLDETALLNGTDTTNAHTQVFALVAHEVAHFLGANEAEAKVVQEYAARSVLNQIVVGKYGVGTFVEDPLTKQQKAWAEVTEQLKLACGGGNKLDNLDRITQLHYATSDFRWFSAEGLYIPFHQGRKGSFGSPSSYLSMLSPVLRRNMMKNMLTKMKEIDQNLGRITSIDELCAENKWTANGELDYVDSDVQKLLQSEFVIEGIPKDWGKSESTS
jgi:hypothetical protein